MPHAAAISWGRAIAWGAYLACSWTWCIGMFLPLLLVRDLGSAGWSAFAVPNVVGAAAMGWVLRSSLAASRLRQNHLWAGRAFSIVTIAFHAYFLAWMGGTLLPLGLVAGCLMFALLSAAAAVVMREQVSWFALAVWVASGAVLAWLLVSQPGAVPATLSRRGELPATDVLWLAPVCAFGFALCPYLDLTFLRARRVCDGPTGAAAFTIGFGLMFASMIVLTLGYAGLLGEPQASAPFLDKPLWAQLAIAHIAVQAGFTVAVHIIELATPEPARVRALGAAEAARSGPAELPVDRSETPDRVPAQPMALGRITLLAAILVAGGAGVGAKVWPDLAGLTAGEIGYRVFMAAYGLVFPTYVWVCVVPRRRPVPGRQLLIAWAAGVVLATPFFAAGFLWRESVWLAPGLLIAMVSRWCVRPSPKRSRALGE